MTARSSRARWCAEEFQGQLAAAVAALVQQPVQVVNMDLAGFAMGTDGANPALLERNLVRASLTGVDWRFASLSCAMSDAIVHQVSFAHTQFDRCIMARAAFTQCDFSHAKLTITANDAVFEDCNFTGATFAGGTRGHEYGGRRVRFVRCDFSRATFNGVEFRASQFTDCTLHDAQFARCDLRGVTVTNGTKIHADRFADMDVPAWALDALS